MSAQSMRDFVRENERLLREEEEKNGPRMVRGTAFPFRFFSGGFYHFRKRVLPEEQERRDKMLGV